MYPAERSAHVCNGERSGKARLEDRGFYRRLSNRAEARLVPGKLRRPCPKDTARLPIRADRQPCCESIQCRGGAMSIRFAAPGRGLSRGLPSGSVSHAKPPRAESLNPVKSPGVSYWWKLCTEIRVTRPKKGHWLPTIPVNAPVRSLGRVTIGRASSGPSFTWALGIFLNGCRLSVPLNEFGSLHFEKVSHARSRPFHWEARPKFGRANKATLTWVALFRMCGG